MKYTGSTAYAERDNGVVTTVGTCKTRNEAFEMLKRFLAKYKGTDIKFVASWVDDNYR